MCLYIGSPSALCLNPTKLVPPQYLCKHSHVYGFEEEEQFFKKMFQVIVYFCPLIIKDLRK